MIANCVGFSKKVRVACIIQSPHSEKKEAIRTIFLHKNLEIFKSLYKANKRNLKKT